MRRGLISLESILTFGGRPHTLHVIKIAFSCYSLLEHLTIKGAGNFVGKLLRPSSTMARCPPR